MRGLLLWGFALLLLIVPSCIPQQDSTPTSTESEETNTKSEESAETPPDSNDDCPEEDKNWAGYNFIIGCMFLSPGDVCDPCIELPGECFTCGDSDMIQCEGGYIYCASPDIQGTPDELPSGIFACNESLECTLTQEQAPYEPCAGKESGDQCWPCDPEEPECQRLGSSSAVFLCDKKGTCYVQDSLNGDGGGKISNNCEGKTCGESCDPCLVETPECMLIDYDPDAFFCDAQGECVVPPDSLQTLCPEPDAPCPEGEKTEVTYSFTVGCDGLQPGDACEPCLKVPEECYTCGDSPEIICEGSFLYCWAPGMSENLDDLPEGPFACTESYECIPMSPPPTPEDPCEGKLCGASCDPCPTETPECMVIDYDPDAFFCDAQGECVVPQEDPADLCTSDDGGSALHIISQYEGCGDTPAWSCPNGDCEPDFEAFEACMEEAGDDADAAWECFSLLPQPIHSQKETQVDIVPSNTPITLVLTSYEPTLWILNNPGETPIEEVLLGGFYSHEIMGLGSGTPVTNHTFETGTNMLYIGIDGTPDFPDEYPGMDPESFDWLQEVVDSQIQEQNDEIAELKAMAENLTGLSVSSFQSIYTGYSFRVGPGDFPQNGNVQAVVTYAAPSDGAEICKQDEGKAIIKVAPSDQPVILLLMGYEPTLWEIDLLEGAELGGVILGGYYSHRVAGVPVGVAVEQHGFLALEGPWTQAFKYVNEQIEALVSQPIQSHKLLTTSPITVP